MLGNPAIDLIIGYGALTARLMSERSLSKPVLIPLAGGPKVFALPINDGKSGKKNFSYLVYSQTAAEDLTTFKHLTGAAEVHVLVDALHLELIKSPGAIDNVSRKAGVKLHVVPCGKDVDAIIKRLPKSGVVYVTPLLRLTDAERRRVFAAINARKLPSFLWLGDPKLNAACWPRKRAASTIYELRDARR